MTHKKCSADLAHISLLFAVALSLAFPASAQWKEKVLYSFQGGKDGAYPAGGVVFDKLGNLYGATQQGGGTNCSPIGYCGTVYQLAPPAKAGDRWAETVLHVFQGKAHNDGEYPSGGVIADAAGNIYGTASYGGSGDCVLLGIKGGCGTVFQLSPPQTKSGEWTYKTLYSFKGGKDGYLPYGDLVFDGAGSLYGATYFGGGKGTTCNPYYQYCGTVFKLSPPKTKGGAWTEKVLHSFAGGTDGANPNGALVLDGKGSVYGTTYSGGYNCPHNSGQGCGAVFELLPASMKGGAWTEAVLHRFKRDRSDGGNPMAGLRFDEVGNLYGTTLNGGPGQYGTVFSLKPPSNGTGAWIETVLHGFNDNQWGAGPEASLIFDTHGDLYGTTAIPNNRSAQGNIFRMRPPTRKRMVWALGVIYTFIGSPDGANPAAALIFDTKGNLYGTTQFGGTGQSCQGGCGTVSQVSPSRAS